jgi:predicted RNA-binding protein with PIN domain
MPIIIDGHNLIGKMTSISLGERDDEEKLVGMLARHLLTHRRKVTVVFDRGTDPERVSWQKGSRLHVIFAPPESCADAIIMDMIKRDPNPKGLTIVSSDNEIRRCARSRRARLVSAEDFAAELESQPEHRRRAWTDGNGLGRIDVADWSEYFRKGKT